MAETANDLATPFSIREMTGDKRALTLRGRALPYRPFELSGTQRNSISWYPGSPIGTLQAYGAKEEPTTVTGQWKDVFIGEHLITSEHLPYAEVTSAEDGIEVSLNTVRDLVRTADDMRRKGSQVEVTWLDQARRGIIDRFTVKWHTGHDCEWEMMFAWTSQAESLANVKFQDPGASDLGDLPVKVQNAVNRLVPTGTVADIVPQAGDRFAGLTSFLDEVTSLLQLGAEAMGDAVNEAVTLGLSGPESLRKSAAVLDGLKLEADMFVTLVNRSIDGAALDQGGVSVINSVELTFGQILSQRAEARDRARSATALRNMAASEQSALLTLIEGDAIRVFQARQDQDLREVSTVFYGSPDDWRGLMIYNRLGSSRLSAGQVVFVPAIPPQDGC